MHIQLSTLPAQEMPLKRVGSWSSRSATLKRLAVACASPQSKPGFLHFWVVLDATQRNTKKVLPGEESPTVDASW